MKIKLKDGLKVGIGDDADIYHDCDICKVTTAILLEAREAAEKPVQTPDGYQLVLSPTRLHIELVRRRIKSIGDIKGPLSETELKSLSDDDMELIADVVSKMDEADGVETGPRTNQESAAD